MLSGKCIPIIKAEDWGPAVSAVMLEVSEIVYGPLPHPEEFRVTEEKEANDERHPEQETVQTVRRRVRSVCFCEENGRPSDTDEGSRIRLDLSYGPEEGSPFRFVMKTLTTKWCDPYRLIITACLKTAAGLEKLRADQHIPLKDHEYLCPDTAVFTSCTFYGREGRKYNCGVFRPDHDRPKALVIWLHGIGEGMAVQHPAYGNDIAIDLLGNRVTRLAEEMFQKAFEGAYVLVPQCPTMWMDDGSGKMQDGAHGSMYTGDLFALIEDFVSSHPDIDRNRIILGGCSNGGYMTMEMILRYPGYFHKAYPICEAYADQYISDDEIQILRKFNTGIWFTYALADHVVDYQRCTAPTYRRMKEAGMDVHCSVYDRIEDQSGLYDRDGKPYAYNGHFSWVYALNGMNEEDGVDMFSWLAE
jgi:predicted peptidase